MTACVVDLLARTHAHTPTHTLSLSHTHTHILTHAHIHTHCLCALLSMCSLTHAHRRPFCAPGLSVGRLGRCRRRGSHQLALLRSCPELFQKPGRWCSRGTWYSRRRDHGAARIGGSGGNQRAGVIRGPRRRGCRGGGAWHAAARPQRLSRETSGASGSRGRQTEQAATRYVAAEWWGAVMRWWWGDVVGAIGKGLVHVGGQTSVHRLQQGLGRRWHGARQALHTDH